MLKIVVAIHEDDEEVASARVPLDPFMDKHKWEQSEILMRMMTELCNAIVESDA